MIMLPRTINGKILQLQNAVKSSNQLVMKISIFDCIFGTDFYIYGILHSSMALHWNGHFTLLVHIIAMETIDILCITNGDILL